MKLLADVSSRLVKAPNAAVQFNDLILNPPTNAQVGDILKAAIFSLGAVDQYAQLDPRLAVVGRRLIIARIAQAYLSAPQEVLASQEEQDLLDIVWALYGIHVRSTVQRGLAHHLHISKSGGTSFSEAADLSNCRKIPGLGQAGYLADLPHWGSEEILLQHTGELDRGRIWMRLGNVARETDIQTCEQRAHAVITHGLQYVSNEYTLFGGVTSIRASHVCPQFVNIVTMRNPEKRLTSHVHYLMSGLVNPYRRAHPDTPERFNQIFCARNASVWYKALYPVIDNYVTRSFVGELGFHTPLSGITKDSEHVEVGLRNLAQFDIIVDLDAGLDAIRLIMNQGLGWNATMADVTVRSAVNCFERREFDVDKEGCRNELLIGNVLRHQEPDRILFRAGRAASFLDGVLFAMSKSLGMRPHLNLTSAEDTTTDRVRFPCGLLSFAAQHWPPRPPSAYLSQAPGRDEDSDYSR